MKEDNDDDFRPRREELERLKKALTEHPPPTCDMAELEARAQRVLDDLLAAEKKTKEKDESE